jgi:hypothetical protein
MLGACLLWAIPAPATVFVKSLTAGPFPAHHPAELCVLDYVQVCPLAEVSTLPCAPHFCCSRLTALCMPFG